MSKAIKYVTVDVPHQPKKGFRREFEENPHALEPNDHRVRRELKSLQDRLSSYYLRHREERERHRLNLLRNLYQLDTYWFEYDTFDERMFRFRCAWMNHIVDEIIDQLWQATACVLKDLWSMETEVDLRTYLNEGFKNTREDYIDCIYETNLSNSPGATNDVDVEEKMAIYMDQRDPSGEYVLQTMIVLKMEIDKLESVVANKREAHRRILLEDLLVIKQNLRKEKLNNGVNLLIERFNDKVTHSLRTIQEYSQKSIVDYMKLLRDVEYICNELTDRLILDTSMPEYEKSILGKELNQFKHDAKAHIQEVDNFNYELRELSRGTSLKKLRGLTKEEYKERIHEIIVFIENAEVPLRVFKAVGFAMQRTEELSDENAHADETKGVNGVSGVLETDYPDDAE